MYRARDRLQMLWVHAALYMARVMKDSTFGDFSDEEAIAEPVGESPFAPHHPCEAVAIRPDGSCPKPAVIGDSDPTHKAVAHFG
jgi:hypothetical protein